LERPSREEEGPIKKQESADKVLPESRLGRGLPFIPTGGWARKEKMAGEGRTKER